jgi:transcriptional regulator with XRE-family HTH domain
VNLSAFLRRELHRRDWSAEEFGRRAGLGTSHVYQILAEKKQGIRATTLDRIAHGLDMTTSQLVAALEGPRATDSSRVDPDLALIVRVWPRLSLSVREAINLLVSAGMRQLPDGPDQLGKDMPDPIYQGPKIPKIPDWKKYKPSRKMDPLLIQPWH